MSQFSSKENERLLAQSGTKAGCRGYFCFLVCRVQKLHKSWMQYRLSDGKYAPCLTGLSFETFRGEKFLTASATFGVKAGN